ncbi:MAG: PilZ domain-containing protein [Sphingomonas sp.]|uniref:PilZ domain-containing protein n=1 Tax=unclassified Sphingomonas TaxID=196159 RepID=UPI002453EF34|nr:MULTISPECIES: PilZ domain-containing protein [unclassified Sphingomonas]MBQ1496844.1 PilZ domain-containing protein [Sphingomonas sp.]MDH4743494.1 PilZ domain-containing protein [Sphingomonas sp. CBMAI 2297]
MEANPAIASENRDEWIERAPRAVATLLVGKLRHEGNPGQLCRVRNLSERGMQIDTIASLLPDMRITVELRGGALLDGAIAWTKGGRAGVRFDTPADVNAILGKPQAEAAAARPRSPRFAADIPARISALGRPIDVVVVDLSQGGACLRMQRPLRPDTEVILMIPGLPSRRCTTRWSNEELTGVAFHDPISYAELSAWLDSPAARG